MTEISNLCRICVNKTEFLNNMQPLFEENNERCQQILKQIEDCAGIALKPKAEYPKMMCNLCLDALNKSVQFRTLCQDSENALLQILMQHESKMDSPPKNAVAITNNELLNFRTEFVEAALITGVEEVVEPPPATKRQKLKAATALVDINVDQNSDDIDIDDNDGDAADDDAAEDVIAVVVNNDINDDTNGDNEISDNVDVNIDFEVATSDGDSEYTIKTKKKKHLLHKNKKKIKKNVLMLKKKRGRPRLKDMKLTATTTTTTTSTTAIGQTNATAKRGRGRKKPDVADLNIMCEICGNIYTKRSLLNMHMRRHLDVKPFECEICGKNFTCPSEISRHIRVHTGEKPYVCNYCGRAFADRSSNIKHERIHTNTRPFICKTCGKSFTYSNVLKNHMLTHTGEKPFPCLPCNKTFSRKHQLDQHCGTNTHKQKLQKLEYIVVKIEEEHLADKVENILMSQNQLLMDKKSYLIPKDEKRNEKQC